MNMKYSLRKLLFLMFFQSLFGYESVCQDTSFNNRTLSQNELSNIATFTKVYGYVRHFYPSTEVDQMKNWEKLIVDNLPKFEKCTNVEDLSEHLFRVFIPYAPLMLINGIGPTNYEISGGKYIVHRKNKGWGNRGENATRTQFIYNSELVKVPIDSVLPNHVLNSEDRLTKKINDEIFLTWPLSIKANDSFTLPHDYMFVHDTASYRYKCSDRYVRMGCIIEIWNVMQHFYPYMDDLQIDNSSLLLKYLQLASEADNEKRFFEVLELFGAEYKDGHAAFMPYPYHKWADYVPPVRLSFIEEKLIVTYIDKTDSPDIQIGDEITSIDGFSAKRYFENKKTRVSSATPTWNTFASCKELLCGELNSTLTLEVLTLNREVKTIELKRSIKVDVLEKQANRRKHVNEYKPGYYYIDLCNLNDSLLNQIELTVLPNAKGVVFDIRGYPRVHVEKLFRHIYTDTMYSAIWQIPIAYFPDRDMRNTQMDTSGRWIIAPDLPRFTSNVAFIIDGRVISAAETQMGIVEYYKLGKIVGEQTAGTNGNVNSLKVFGLYMFWFTGMKVLKHDGSAHHGIGILPQLNVQWSMKDVLEGIDPFVEAAKNSLF